MAGRILHLVAKIRYHICDAIPERVSDGTVIWDTIITDATDLQYYERMASRMSEIAKIGGWELNLTQSGEPSKVYWSPVTRSLFEVNSEYNPSITQGSEFYTKESKDLAEEALEKLIKKGEKFDLELKCRTQSGKLKWIRCIGDCDKIDSKVVRVFGSFQDIDKRKKSRISS